MADTGTEVESTMGERLAVLEATLKALQDQQEWTETLLSTIPARVIRTSVEGVIEYVNYVTDRSGSPSPVGLEIFQLAPKVYHPKMREALRRAVQYAEVTHFELELGLEDRGQFSFLFGVGPVFRRGVVSGAVLVGTDISQLKRVEAELREHKLRLQLAVGAAGLGIWRWDRKKDLIEWDERMLEFFDLQPGQAPRTVDEYMKLIPEDQRRVVENQIRDWLEFGRSSEYELRIDSPQGARWFAVRGGVIKGDGGEICGLIGVLADITQHRLLEETLRHQQKMVAAGQLSAGVAHNFNNMLAVILPALELAREESSPQIARLLDDAIESASNAAQLVRDLMTFSKNAPRVPSRREPLSCVVRRAVELCQRTFERRVEFFVDGLDAVQLCRVDSASMEQAIMNLLINARDALELVSDRTPRISVQARELHAAEVAHRRYSLSGGPYVELRVIDNGRGMTDAIRQRVMEPFFTTKEAGRGTGLGLSTAWATLQHHEGVLECTSTPGEGTCFTLVLPQYSSEASPISPSTTAPLRDVTSALVLMIDDEPGVLRATTHVLEAAGYRVISAESGIEGLSIVDRTPVDLVLMDYSMPGLPAETILAELRRRLPEVPVVSMSGLGSTLDGADAYLTKPVERDKLLETLQSALLRPSQGRPEAATSILELGSPWDPARSKQPQNKKTVG